MKRCILTLLAFSLALTLFFPGCSAPPAEHTASAPEVGYAVYDAVHHTEVELACVDVGFNGGLLWLLGENTLLQYDAVNDTQRSFPMEKPYRQLAAAADGVWLSDGTELTKLDTDGSLIETVLLAETPLDMVCDAADILYAAQKKSVVLVHPKHDADETQRLDSVSLPDGFTPGTLCSLGDGAAVYASRVRGEQPTLLRLNAGELTASPFAGETPPFPSLFSGRGSGDYYYVNSSYYDLLSEGKQVFHYADGAIQPVFDLAGLDYDGRLRSIIPLREDFLVVYSTAARVGILCLVRTERTKKILTMARAETNGQLSACIARFNAANRDCYIASKFYDGENGEQQLFLDFLSGDRPDILSLNGLTPEVFASKGLLADLYPMLDREGGVSREDLLPEILRVLEASDHALYQLCPSFALSTCAVPKQFLREPKLPLETLYSVFAENPGLTLYGGQRGFAALNFLLSSIFPDFAELETRELRFDSPEFVRFLEFVQEADQRAKEFTGDYRYTDGSVFLCPITILQTEDYRSLLQSEEMQRLILTGFPANTGTGCLITLPLCFGIVAGTGNESSAWTFFEFMLSETEQAQSPLLPMRSSVLEEQLSKLAESTPAHSETVYVDPNGAKAGINTETQTVRYPALKALTPQELSDFRRTLDAVSHIYNEQFTNPCFGIVYEECRALLTGERSAEATAKEIQSKMQLYLAERS